MYYKTTKNAGHLHYYIIGGKNTTMSANHKHKIEGTKALPNRPGGHIHKLTKVLK